MTKILSALFLFLFTLFSFTQKVLALDSTQVILPSDMATSPAEVLSEPSSWFFYNDENDTIDNSLGSFVNGPATPPQGDDSVQISVTGTQRRNLATYRFSGTPLSDITTLSFSTYNPSAGNPGSVNRSAYLNFNVDFNGSDTWQRRLIFVPSQNGTVLQNTWQAWDAINGGAAMWAYSGPTWPAAVSGSPDDGITEAGSVLRTWSDILADYPGIRIRTSDSWLGLRVGEPYADGYTENMDAFVFGTAAGTTTFDFELSVPDTTPPTTPTMLGFKDPILACSVITNIHSTTVDWSDSTDDSGLMGYEYAINYPLPGNVRADWSTFLVPSEYTGSLNEGLHHIKVRAKDNAGNFSEWSNICDITADWTAPDVFITNPADASVLSGTVDVRGTVTDDNPHHYWFVIQDSSSAVVAGPGTVNSALSFTDQSLLSWDTTLFPNGTYTIKLEARDAANNKDAGSVAWHTVTVNNIVDTDGDGINDDVDNCPLVKNKNQKDLDNDGLGNPCDDDKDGDGVPATEDCDDLNKFVKFKIGTKACLFYSWTHKGTLPGLKKFLHDNPRIPLHVLLFELNRFSFQLFPTPTTN